MDAYVEQENPDSAAEYAVIGAGPAAICAVAKLYASGVPGKKIIWIDPKFNVGYFGAKLSVGSSVPGNTSVKSYQTVNNAIYELIPECAPSENEKLSFEITKLPPEINCPIKIAAQPLQHITNKLRKLVSSLEAMVSAIDEFNMHLRINLQSDDGLTRDLQAKRIILAIGAEPKTMRLPYHITLIDPHVAFIESELNAYLIKNPDVRKVAIIGSSHSAALSTMHFLQAGIYVKQFMNKNYKFAIPTIAANGRRYTQFDNTGLKGVVAAYTRQLLEDKTKANGLWECHIGSKNLDTHMQDCTHAVVCVGYKAVSTLQLHGLPLKAYKHDKFSTQILQKNGENMPGIFGIGIAYPSEVKSISGEVELAVGVEKFWVNLNTRVLNEWKENPYECNLAQQEIPPISQQATCVI